MCRRPGDQRKQHGLDRGRRAGGLQEPSPSGFHVDVAFFFNTHSKAMRIHINFKLYHMHIYNYKYIYVYMEVHLLSLAVYSEAIVTSQELSPAKYSS